MKRVISLLLIVSLMLCFSGCCFKHEYIPATCTTPPTCTKCGEMKGEKLGHDWSEATCLTPKTCLTCKTTDGDPLGHSWSEATCANPKTCSICNLTDGDKLEHSYTKETTAEATCTSLGIITYTCDNCKDSYTEDVKMISHSYSAEVTKDATCEKEGVTTYTCECGHSYTESIKATGHNYSSKVTQKATCKNAGVTTYSCDTCEHTYTETIKETDHNYSSKVTKKATCEETGVRTYTCDNCDKSYTESIKATGHDWVSATCTEAKYCKNCNQKSGKALEHSYVDATSTTPKTCSRCGHTVGEPETWYDANTYKVGVDIPAGEYYIKCTSTYMCYFAICKDSSGNSIIENENFSGHHFVTLENGQYFELVRGKCTPVDKIVLDVDLQNITVGMYRVGIDIPAGEYKVTKSDTYPGYFAVYDNSKATRKIRTNDNFENSQYVTVYAGEYLYLSRCTATLIQNAGSTPNNNIGSSTNNNLWSPTDATTLNTYADQATKNAQEAWDYAIDAITASSTYKVIYNQYAVYYAGITKGYLESMKALADSKATLSLTNTNGNYSTLQEKIDYAYKLCDEIVNLEITSINYTVYEDDIRNITQELSLECLGIQKLSVDLIGAFVS